jgi:hypothetical protein
MVALGGGAGFAAVSEEAGEGGAVVDAGTAGALSVRAGKVEAGAAGSAAGWTALAQLSASSQFKSSKVKVKSFFMSFSGEGTSARST